MSDENFELTRRRVLGSLGVVGLTGAAAGFGTSAYFSDSETFDGSTLTAGELDLKVDWEEHYSDWSADENVDIKEADGGESQEDDGEGRFSVEMEEPTNPDAFKAFPPGTESDFNGSDPLLWVPNPYVDDFMVNTVLESFPDVNNDGTAEYPADELAEFGTPCDFLADVGGEDGDLGSYTTDAADTIGRTDNEDTRLEDESPAPLINLQDVKPGDFGEVTFSTHLCDNPGYLWMNMPDGLTASENGLSEPEAKDPDEDQTIVEGEVVPKDGVEDPSVELVDELQTAIWYDNNCDNLFTCEENLDIMAVADTSGSIDGILGDAGEGGTDDQEQIDLIAEGANIFVNELESRAEDPSKVRAGLLTFNGQGDAGEDAPEGSMAVFDRPALRAGLDTLDQFDRTDDGTFNANVEEFLPSEGNGNTPMPHALDLAAQVLNDDPDARDDARKVILLVTDGLPNYEPPDSPLLPYTVTENEGGPLPNTSQEYTAGVYDSEGFSTSEERERDETAELAAQLQQQGIEVLVAGVGLEPTGDTFLSTRVAGQDGDETVAEPNYFFNVNFPDQVEEGEQPIDEAAEDLAQFLVGGDGECEKTIFTGSLREAAEVLTGNEGRGIPLTSNQAADYDELNDPENAESRECFSPGHTSCFGFSWWLPVDHANEIQTDGVAFDLGFYTEQCRHNDGAGTQSETAD
ncbi:VWA domain-containing protein [Halapricum desulfuricans]|nr:VWA domain-containing protein [Halapricum desulfuricans]